MLSDNEEEILYHIAETNTFMTADGRCSNDIEDEDEDEDDEEDDMEDDEEEEFDLMYYSISSKEKLELFKQNFEEFINIMLDKKNVEKRKNNRTRVYIIKGMRDYFEYVIGMLDEIYEIDKIQKDYYSLDLSKFV